jgi:ketosteroid isomerase-like protein
MGTAAMPSVSVVQAEIEDRLTRHFDALSRGDADAALELFASDAVVRPANVEPLRGVAALREFFERTFAAMTVGEWTFYTEELYLYDSQAFHFGTYQFHVSRHGGDTDAQKGSFAIVWKRQRDQSWRYHRGIMNNSGPTEGRTH